MVLRDDPVHLRLLQHDLGDEDVIGIARCGATAGRAGAARTSRAGGAGSGGARGSGEAARRHGGIVQCAMPSKSCSTTCIAARRDLDEIDGWHVPLTTAIAAAEYRAVREGAGVVDRSDAGQGRGRPGATARAFLQGMLSNDVKALAPGQGCARRLPRHPRQGAWRCSRVYALDDRLLLELPPEPHREDARGARPLPHLGEGRTSRPSTTAFAVAAVQGPRRAGAAAKARRRDAVGRAPYAHAEARSSASARARDPAAREAGAPGFHCWRRPRTAPALAGGARGGGRAARRATRRSRRSASRRARRWYGRDVDDTVLLPETPLARLVSYTKGCYIGQEVVARVKYRGHVNRALCRPRARGRARARRRARASSAEGKEIGRVTSRRALPRARPPDRARLRAARALRAGHRGRRRRTAARSSPARVAALPFVEPAA